MRAPTRDDLRRIVITLVVIGAVAGMAWAVSRDPKTDDVAQPGVERIYPPPGDLDLRQVKIGAILSPGYEGALTLDGAVIPESDLYRESSLYQIELRPEEGSVFADLKPGRHCASIVFWRTAQGRKAAATQQWCFNLH